jgi:hypothetical protein
MSDEATKIAAGGPVLITYEHVNKWLASVALASALLLTPLMAAAQDDLAVPRFAFRIGGQAFTGFTSKLRLDSETLGRGTEINLEDDAGLEERISVGRADGVLNFNARHHLLVSLYNIERTGTRAISEEIHFRDKVFAINTTVSTVFSQDIVKVGYGFNVLHRPRAILGPSFGFHVMNLGAGMHRSEEPLTEDTDTTAPLPVFGARGEYLFADRWRLQGSLDWFDVQTGDAQGVFRDFVVTVEHDTFDRFGFGFGLNNLDFDLESGDADFKGTVELAFNSFLFYFKGGFGEN